MQIHCTLLSFFAQQDALLVAQSVALHCTFHCTLVICTIGHTACCTEWCTALMRILHCNSRVTLRSIWKAIAPLMNLRPKSAFLPIIGPNHLSLLGNNFTWFIAPMQWWHLGQKKLKDLSLITSRRATHKSVKKYIMRAHWILEKYGGQSVPVAINSLPVMKSRIKL